MTQLPELLARLGTTLECLRVLNALRAALEYVGQRALAGDTEAADALERVRGELERELQARELGEAGQSGRGPEWQRAYEKGYANGWAHAVAAVKVAAVQAIEELRRP